MADRIRNSARRFVHVKSGDLRKTIRVDARGKSITVVAGSAKVYWGPFNEYGTVRMKAIPFMRPAFEEVTGNFSAPNIEAELLG